MDRNDFVDHDAWLRYKFERESYIEEIQRLDAKLQDEYEHSKWLAMLSGVAVVFSFIGLLL